MLSGLPICPSACCPAPTRHIIASGTLEGFFGTLKSDLFEDVDWTGVTFAEFRRRLGAYIEWYRGGKLKRSLGWRTIEQYRRDMGYAA